MNMPTEQELKEFANALQLSIKTKIINVLTEKNSVIIKLDTQPQPDDLHFHNLTRLFQGSWRNEQKEYIIHNADKVDWPKITLFLLLTRMNEDNILKLVKIDPTVEEIGRQLGYKCSGANVDSVKACSRRIFKIMEKKKMTIRELSEKTGLSQVSISNFKAGKDVRLSNLLKIISALGIRLKI